MTQTLLDLQKTAYNTKWGRQDNGLNTYDRIGRIIDAIGCYRNVDQMVIDKAVAWISETWSNPATARRVGNDFKSMVSISQRYGLIDEKLRVDLPSVTMPRRQPFTGEQMTLIDEVFSVSPHRGNLYRVLRDCGLRGVGKEVRSLLWSDLGCGLMTVHSEKGGKHTTRVVPVPDALNRTLECFRGNFYSPIFSPALVNSFEDVWNKEVRPLIPGAVPYQLRHTYATRLLSKGIPVHVVSNIMGHADIKTTMIYAHIQPSDLDKVRAAL